MPFPCCFTTQPTSSQPLFILKQLLKCLILSHLSCRLVTKLTFGYCFPASASALWQAPCFRRHTGGQQGWCRQWAKPVATRLMFLHRARPLTHTSTRGPYSPARQELICGHFVRGGGRYHEQPSFMPLRQEEGIPRTPDIMLDIKTTSHC